MPQVWASVSKQIWIRSLKWGTVCCRSRGCQNIRDQSLRLKRNCWLGLIRINATGASWTGGFFINLQPWPLIFLQPLNLQECTVPHLKDLIHICLEPELQGCGMTFNRFYVGSKYPYFISYRGKWVYLFCRGCSLRANSRTRSVGNFHSIVFLVD